MKTKLMLALFAGALSLSAQAQTNNTTVKQDETKKAEISPEQAAERQANKAETELGLTADQKTKFQSFSLTRITAVRPLREKIKAETDKEKKRDLHKELNGHFQVFNKNVNEILTAEQKVKWEAHKKEAKEKNKARKEAKVPFED